MEAKKRPGDYPQLAFRISREDKANIHLLTEEVLRVSNAALPPADKRFRKNDVLVDALYLGLLALKKSRVR